MTCSAAEATERAVEETAVLTVGDETMDGSWRTEGGAVTDTEAEGPATTTFDGLGLGALGGLSQLCLLMVGSERGRGGAFAFFEVGSEC